MTGPYEIRGKGVLVIGLGKTGWSCLRWLHEQGANLTVLDTRAQPPMLNDLQMSGMPVRQLFGTDSVTDWQAIELVVVSPGVDLQLPAVRAARERGLPVIGDIELFIHVARAPVVAITGSNGKSTVTTLFADMARAAGRQVAAGGNLGTPALELLDEEPDLYVLELSSFQLELTHSMRSAAAVVLNVSPDHMDRHGSLENYAEIKARVYRDTRRAVINRDDPLAAQGGEGCDNAIGFTAMLPAGTDYGLQRDGDAIWLMRGEQRIENMQNLRMQGLHNGMNALAALALGEAIGLDEPSMLSALREFAGLPHRCEWVAERNGVRWINDSKGTNVGASVAAIKGLPGPLILLAGGQGKGADFAPLGESLREKGKAAVLYGQDAEQIAATLETLLPVHRENDLDHAVQRAATLSAPGDTVLLSPACASLDQFTNYEQRGECFRRAVEGLQ